MSDVAIVVPTVRSQQIQFFLSSWDWGSTSYDILVIEDNPKPSISLPNYALHYSWQDIDEDLGEFSWIIPRRTDCIRSYGFLKALGMGAKVIITLDDDCLPSGSRGHAFVRKHVDELNIRHSQDAWDTLIMGAHQRGMPTKQDRRWMTAVNVGLWEDNLDLSAAQRVVGVPGNVTLFEDSFIPHHRYVPMCGMNLSFPRWWTYAMYFLLMGKGYPFDRFGDIWCGVFSKRMCDHLRLNMVYGHPHVRHAGLSNAMKSLVKEAPGTAAHEHLWSYIDETLLTANNVSGSYLQLADAIEDYPHHSDGYWDKLAEAMRIWVKLVGERM